MTDDTTEILARLLIQWEDAIESGTSIDPKELCVDNPQLLNQLNEGIDQLKRMAWLTQEESIEHIPDPLIDQKLDDRYLIISGLGMGGFGTVYRAMDEQLRREVAIKIARPDRMRSKDILIEAQLTARLRHPNIISIHDLGRYNGSLYIVSEYIKGKNLAELLIAGDLLQPHAINIFREIADALQTAHGQGIYHCDVKPSNIIIDQKGTSYLGDFGISISRDEINHKMTSVYGTLAYMAPEQILGEKKLIGPSTDIFALGIVLYYMITGEHPFQAKTDARLREKIILKKPRGLRELNPLIPDQLEAICLKCLNKHPYDRYSSASEILQDLSAIA